MSAIDFRTLPPNPDHAALRQEVRDFLAVEIADLPAHRRAMSWTGADPAFSRKLGQRGWLAMTWPKAYGGHDRSAFERLVVIEELLAAGAPVSAHWIADRQSGPLILRVGTEVQKQKYLPAIAAGDCFISAGLSEPDTGSDLASARLSARKVDGGYILNGSKIWTTQAHNAHAMIVLCRTAPLNERARHEGFSQIIVDFPHDNVTISPIADIQGEHHFNEVVFRDAFVPDTGLLGREGDGWAQIISELASERSGPERFLSSFVLLAELVRAFEGQAPGPQAEAEVGRAMVHLAVLRNMSRAVAGMVESGQDPNLQAAVVKDLGATFEQETLDIVRRLIGVAPRSAAPGISGVFATTLLQSPSFSLRGGSREILRGIIARGLGLR